MEDCEVEEKLYYVDWLKKMCDVSIKPTRESIFGNEVKTSQNSSH